MHIIKHGELKNALRLLRFNCTACGCIFNAGPHEYRMCDKGMITNCPDCYNECISKPRTGNENISSVE